DLRDREQAALKLDREFFVKIETRAARRSHDLVLLDALRALDQLPGTASLSDLAAAYRHRAGRSAALKADVAGNLEDDAALIKFLREGPAQAWCDERDSEGRTFLALSGEQLSTGEGIRGDSVE